MALKEIPYLVCDNCGTEAAGDIVTRTIKIDRREVENDLCPKCDDRLLGKVRALMGKGRKRASRRTKVA